MLTVTKLAKTFSASTDKPVRVIDDISFQVRKGMFFTLLGPSGCGKTTTLRSIAGLERPDGGAIRIGNELVFDGDAGLFVPPNKRQVGMVFQSYAIWPHMNVFENVAFPLRVSRPKPPEAEIKRLVMDALATVHLEGYHDRPATRLSGGQQQRLALARAIVTKPDLLLLDEPLSNLDAKLRESMRSELRRLQRDVGITTIYVTHDQSEALAMSDEVAVMNEGVIVQRGAPDTIYNEPATRFVASFIGLSNLIPGQLDRVSSGAARAGVAQTSFGSIRCVSPGGSRGTGDVLLSIRPEKLSLRSPEAKGPTPEGERNLFPGRIAEKVFLGEVVEYTVAVQGAELRVRGFHDTLMEVGRTVDITCRPEDCLALQH